MGCAATPCQHRWTTSRPPHHPLPVAVVTRAMGRPSCSRSHREHPAAPHRRHRAARPRLVADSGLFAEVHWDFPLPGSRLGEGSLWGTPEAMRRLAALAIQAAIHAKEEACWQAHQATTTAAAQGSRVA
jgi:hypothetical protein